MADASKFSKLDIETMEICQRRENRLVRFLRDTLLKQKIITEEVYRQLFPSGSVAGVLYGLPKVHKDNFPARPILSAIGTYNYNLAKFLVPILQPFAVGQYTVKDSFAFVSEITAYKTDFDLVMASFDVSSLFTNVPLDECVDLCVDLLFEDCDTFAFKDCKFNRDQFRKLLNFAVKDNHFVFNGQLYDQIDGVAMGSPLGPSMANIFMCALEQKYLNGCPSEFKPVLYRRYVDDTFCLFRHREHVDKFLEYINNFHPNIKFTVEVEEDNNLPFLDVLVTHEQTGFSTSLYRKKTFTGLYTDYASLAPDKYKINLVRILVFRAFHICSTYMNFHHELIRIKRILTENCFPRSIIDRVIKSFLGEKFGKRPPKKAEDKAPLIFCLPYLGHYSLQVKTRLIRLVKQCYPKLKLEVIFTSPKRISFLFRFKDKLPSLICSSVVYRYRCPGCHASYYGKTTRNLVVRCREHLGINKAGQKIKSSPSAIGDHISKSGHDASLENFEIISRTVNSFDLLIHESLLILRDRPMLNSQLSSISLALF